LNPHIKDVARRVAKAGFVALAPDALSGTGGTPQNEDEARDLIGKLDAVKNLNNFLKALQYAVHVKSRMAKPDVWDFAGEAQWQTSLPLMILS
jgi:carboxymethylenebutenolidase